MKLQNRTLHDYLLTIYRLEGVFVEARTVEISRMLRVTPATVSKTIRGLAEAGYVVWTPYEGVKLTEAGRRISEGAVRKHRIAEYFLVNRLGFSIVEAHRLAHMLEHMPDEFFEKLYDFLGRPNRCPHGNPIPGSETPPEVLEAKPINRFSAGDTVEIVRVACIELFGDDLAEQIKPGTCIEIEEQHPDATVILVEDSRIKLMYPLNHAVFAKPGGVCSQQQKHQ